MVRSQKKTQGRDLSPRERFELYMEWLEDNHANITVELRHLLTDKSEPSRSEKSGSDSNNRSAGNVSEPRRKDNRNQKKVEKKKTVSYLCSSSAWLCLQRASAIPT